MLRKASLLIGIPDEHCANRISKFIPTGTSKAGDRNSNIRIHQLTDTGDHLPCHWIGYCTVVFQYLLLDTKDILFDLICIADDSALIHCRASGN
mgnify:CR=1 FL=1